MFQDCGLEQVKALGREREWNKEGEGENKGENIALLTDG